MDTYTNEDIVSVSRVWTGWDEQPTRSNIANVNEAHSSNDNNIDTPHPSKADRHAGNERRSRPEQSIQLGLRKAVPEAWKCYCPCNAGGEGGRARRKRFRGGRT